MDPNIFSWGFTGWSIFVPQLLLALLAILLGSTFQFLVKNNINVLICIGLGAIGSIFYLTDVKPSPENIFMQSFAKPSIILSILILIGYPIGFLYIRNANIII
jgi:hypothetical protein